MKKDENLDTDMYTISHNISVITSTDIILKNDSNQFDSHFGLNDSIGEGKSQIKSSVNESYDEKNTLNYASNNIDIWVEEGSVQNAKTTLMYE